ncbi:MAG: SRPBCC family protein [Prevotella sp.]|jgi:hypothetical protein|nr:SRPBCC family protein [Prevotella sp.]
MSKFESSVRQIPYPQQKVYDTLSNLENLAKIRDRIPADKLQDFSFDNDSITVKAAPVGEIKMHIIEREEPKTIKFETEKSPVPLNFWIQLLPVTADSCKMKLTVKAELNPFIAGMVKKPLQEGIDKIADALERISY